MTTAKKLSHEEFTLRAIKALRTDKSKGIHTVYSGFNSAFTEYFGTSPVEATKALQESGKLDLIPRKGGVMIYLPGEAPQGGATNNTAQTKKALAAILK